MLTFAYDAGESPPASYLDIEIGPSLPGAPTIPWRAKLDCGASITIIPADLVVVLNIDPIGAVYVRGYEGQPVFRLLIESIL